MKKSSVSLILIGEGDETERKADQFASYFLIFPFHCIGWLRKLEKMPIELILK
ncbi:hypothetical protein A66_01739 [Streptococcus pneumoniae]|nr:hypothetical protein A66_01739 [Streptococcus pneumoniae]